jgi:hypothetical protein
MVSSFFARFPLLVMALAASTWATCQAIGSFQTRPAFPDVARAGNTPVLPATTWHKLSPSPLVGSCGEGRVSDPQTHGCRGPADIRSTAP